MAINTTFGALKTRIAREINKDASTFDDDIGDAIVSAIKDYEHLPAWFLETTTTLTVLTSEDSASLPSGFRRVLNARVLIGSQWKGRDQGFIGLSYREMQDNNLDSTATGAPESWAILGNTFYVNRVADADYSIDLVYTRGDTTYPSASGSTSLWFEDATVDAIRLKAESILYRDRFHAYDRADRLEAEAAKIINRITVRNNTQETRYRLT